MLNLEQGTTVEPPGSALLRLAELEAAINTATSLLSLADARAIWRELNAVARALKQITSP